MPRVIRRFNSSWRSHIEKVGDIQGSPYHTGTPANLGDTAGAFESYQKISSHTRAIDRRESRQPGCQSRVGKRPPESRPDHGRSGDSAGALESHRRGLSILEQLAANEPDNTEIREQLADNYQNPRFMLMQAENLRRPSESAQKAVSIF